MPTPSPSPSLCPCRISKTITIAIRHPLISHNNKQPNSHRPSAIGHRASASVYKSVRISVTVCIQHSTSKQSLPEKSSIFSRISPLAANGSGHGTAAARSKQVRSAICAKVAKVQCIFNGLYCDHQS